MIYLFSIFILKKYNIYKPVQPKEKKKKVRWPSAQRIRRVVGDETRHGQQYNSYANTHVEAITLQMKQKGHRSIHSSKRHLTTKECTRRCLIGWSRDYTWTVIDRRCTWLTFDALDTFDGVENFPILIMFGTLLPWTSCYCGVCTSGVKNSIGCTGYSIRILSLRYFPK